MLIRCPIGTTRPPQVHTIDVASNLRHVIAHVGAPFPSPAVGTRARVGPRRSRSVGVGVRGVLRRPLRVRPPPRRVGGSRGGYRARPVPDRKSTRLNSSHEWISYAVFCLKKKTDTVSLGSNVLPFEYMLIH